MITPQQIRGARAMLGLTQKQLADASGVSEMSVKNIERGSTPDPRVSTMLAMKKSLESAGVEFIPENGGGPGVRLRKVES